MHQSKYKMIMFVLFLAVSLLIGWLNQKTLSMLLQFLLQGDIEAILSYIRSFGQYAAVICFFIIVAINVVAVLPNIFVLAAAGIIFGIWEGTLIAWIAESVGVIISFVLMRYFFRDYAHVVIEKSNALQKVNDFSGKNGFTIMLIARSIPFVPSGLITALGAISDIRLKDYILATFIGKFPSALIEVTMGHDLASYRENETRLILLIVLSAAAYFGYVWYKKRTA
ncbi:Uncharacterized membrane protein YdjX, TVP38/TMEM64 family, SNARE-associated domain [Propionispira arboris]|uniref:TVP38/TMEM64 family membrane protein n=1 Tax=Propionispira arboris TaxID=84035 RepID=A0A1H7AQ26_9FIRM|nr:MULTISPECIES: TVP38/TMEM64 family protein [Propionispira]SEJ64192.1 Uncharacterized membrane protein YdjX, TVP38/TMEM64 family, SNARE-associated domain [Propionispira arboris]